ncbi:hypothetical protein RGQ29_024581 [Quercus rubra]|uniref:ARGOS-like protein n=1 Tax=Quercus rubra TaxID=3512 RepID=A0AAN7EVP7_QUERU|nr:hypothetical protein RGQ29_024581 [Quercus rubra]
MMKTHEMELQWRWIGREKYNWPVQGYMIRYFSLTSILVLVVLTISLLVLPLVLPPLPPPPLLLLSIPVLIMVALIFLAFLPSQLTNVAVTSV